MASATPTPSLQSDPLSPRSGLYHGPADGKVVYLDAETWAITDVGEVETPGCLLSEASFTSDTLYPPGFWYDVGQCGSVCEFEDESTWWSSTFLYGQCVRARFFKDGPESRIMFRGVVRLYDVQPFAAVNWDGPWHLVATFGWSDPGLLTNASVIPIGVTCDPDLAGQTITHTSTHTFVDCAWSTEERRILDYADATDHWWISGVWMKLDLIADQPTRSPIGNRALGLAGASAEILGPFVIDDAEFRCLRCLD